MHSKLTEVMIAHTTKLINLGTTPILYSKKYLLIKAKENMRHSIGIFALK
jgi:hypothetical protein